MTSDIEKWEGLNTSARGKSIFNIGLKRIKWSQCLARIPALPLTSLMLCVLLLYMIGETYNLKSISNDRFLRNFFMAMLFTLRVFARKLRENCRRNISFHNSFSLNRGLTFNKPTLYLLDHGYFKLSTQGSITS